MRMHNPATSGKPIHVFTAGAFGAAVVIRLRTLMTDVIVTACDTAEATGPSYWPPARLHAIAAWRPVPRLARILNQTSYAWKTPFIPAVLEASHLVVGPVVVPGLGACHACYERRRLQHDPRPEARSALLNQYEQDPDSGAQGHLAVFADIAAVRMAQSIRQVETEPAQAAGRVWRFDVLTRQVAASVVTGVHGCVHCGLRREEATRSYAGLHEELSWLLQQRPATRVADWRDFANKDR